MVKKQFKREMTDFITDMKMKELSTPKINPEKWMNQAIMSNQNKANKSYDRNEANSLYRDYQRRQFNNMQMIYQEEKNVSDSINQVKSN